MIHLQYLPTGRSGSASLNDLEQLFNLHIL